MTAFDHTSLKDGLELVTLLQCPIALLPVSHNLLILKLDTGKARITASHNRGTNNSARVEDVSVCKKPGRMLRT